MLKSNIIQSKVYLEVVKVTLIFVVKCDYLCLIHIMYINLVMVMNNFAKNSEVSEMRFNTNCSCSKRAPLYNSYISYKSS